MTTTAGVGEIVDKSRQESGESKFWQLSADLLYNCVGLVITRVILLLLFQAVIHLGESVTETIKDHNPHYFFRTLEVSWSRKWLVTSPILSFVHLDRLFQVCFPVFSKNYHSHPAFQGHSRSREL